MDDDKKQDIPSYVKLPYPQVNKENKKTKKEHGKFKRFIDIVNKLQVNIPFGEALE